MKNKIKLFSAFVVVGVLFFSSSDWFASKTNSIFLLICYILMDIQLIFFRIQKTGNLHNVSCPRPQEEFEKYSHLVLKMNIPDIRSDITCFLINEYSCTRFIENHIVSAFK